MKESDIKEVLNEIEQHNDSWFQDIYERNKGNLDAPALWYRGTNISYQEMLKEANRYAKSLRKLGIKQGDEVSACLSNTPELIYLLMAISMLGAKINLFGSQFDQDYIKKIIDDCSSKVFFATDCQYEDIKNITLESSIEKIVLVSLTSSLKDGIDPYDEVDKIFCEFGNKIPEFQCENDKIIDVKEFAAFGDDMEDIVPANTNLDDEFTITYSSGSTHSTRPKAIVHRIRSFVTMARFHDSDVSGLPAMKNIRGLAHIPPHSNTDLITSISDVLSQHGTVALEPIYDQNFFLPSLMINKPNFVPATTSFWLNAAKKIRFDESYRNLQLPFLIIPTAVGEPVAPNEEKFINKALKTTKAGKDLFHLPYTPVCLSIGGGDCEHGGLFFTLYKALQEKRLSCWLRKKSFGLKPFALAEYAVLDRNGKRCGVNELGRLVANSNCTMKGYKNNPEATRQFFIYDNTGKRWGDCQAYGYIDQFGSVHIKGRIGNEFISSNGEKIPLFLIRDEILKDTKHILSCELVMVKDDKNDDKIVAHIEFQPGVKINVTNVLMGAEKRCKNVFSDEVLNCLCYRIRGMKESFPLSGCGKRSQPLLKAEGYDGDLMVKPSIETGQLLTANQYKKENTKVYCYKR